MQERCPLSWVDCFGENVVVFIIIIIAIVIVIFITIFILNYCWYHLVYNYQLSKLHIYI